MPLVGGALAAALFLLGRRLGAPRAAAVLVAAGIVLGTYLLPYGRDFFTEPLVALGLVVMVERALAGRELQAGAALAFAVLARPQSAAFAPLLFGFLLLRGGGLQGDRPHARAARARRARHRRLQPPPLPRPAASSATSRRPTRASPRRFFEGAGGLLFSPEKSIVLFAPAIVLVPFALVALWRRDAPTTACAAAALFAATFGLAATWWSWQGGWSWGPRLVIPGVALLLVALGPWIGAGRAGACASPARCSRSASSSRSRPCWRRRAGSCSTRAGTDGPQIVRQYGVVPELTERSIDAADDRCRARRRLPPLPRRRGRPTSSARSAAGPRCRPLLVTLLLLAALAAVSAGLDRRTRARLIHHAANAVSLRSSKVPRFATRTVGERNMARPIILGVVGDSATGKTTLTKGLVEILGTENVTHIGMDDYHCYDRAERKEHKITPLNPKCNYMDIIEQHIAHLRKGEPILKPHYQHGDGTFGRPEYVKPQRFILIEGLLGYHTTELASLFDVRVYLNPPEELRREWKVKRDTTKRGYTEEQVLAELDMREPDSEAFIRPQRSRADIVVAFQPGVQDDPDHLDAVLTLREGLPHPDLSSLDEGSGETIEIEQRASERRLRIPGEIDKRARRRHRGGHLGADALRPPSAHRAARVVLGRHRRGAPLRVAGDHPGPDPVPPGHGEGHGRHRRRRRRQRTRLELVRRGLAGLTPAA